MKKTIVSILFLIIAQFSVEAQVAITPEFEYRGGKFYQKGVELSEVELYSVIGQRAYDKHYSPAMIERQAGIVVLSISGASLAAGLGFFLYAASIPADSDDLTGKVMGNLCGTCFTLGSVGNAVLGGILLGAGNRRLRSIRPVSNGVGVAMAF